MTAHAPTAPLESVPTGQLVEIPLDQIDSTPNRGMRNIGELAASIRAQGLLQPIVVAPTNAKATRYQVVAGRRRFAACQAGGLMFVPAIVRDLDPQARLEAALVENLQRDDLKPMEEARLYDEILTEFPDLTAADLALRVTRSEAHISKRRSLLKLTDDVQAAVDDERITITAALAMVPLVDYPDRLEAVTNLIDDTARNDPDEPDNRVADSTYITRMAEAQVEALEVGQRRTDVAAELERMGETVLDYPPLGDYGQLKPRGKWRVCRRGEKPEAYAVDPRAHTVKLTKAPLPDDKRQTKTKEPTAAEREATEAAERVARERDAAADRRQSVMRAILDGTKRIAKDKLAEFVVHQAVAGDTSDGESQWRDPQALVACEVLGLDVKGVPRYSRKYEAVLRDYAASGALETTRVGAALAFSRFEPDVDEIAGDLVEWDDPCIRNHYGFLAAHGYELTAEETTAFEAAADQEKKKR